MNGPGFSTTSLFLVPKSSLFPNDFDDKIHVDMSMISPHQTIESIDLK